MRMRLKGMLRPIAAIIGIVGIVRISGAGGPVPAADPLLRPAHMTTHAANGVLLGLARAGDRLVAVGERGRILISERHGKSWRQVKVPVSVTLTAVSFGSPHKVWAVGHAGVILHSADGGESWSKQLDGVQAAQIELGAARAAASLGSATDADRRRLRDATRAAAEGAVNPLLAVHFWSGTEGLAAGAYGALFHTADGGRTWSSVRARLENPRGKHLYSIHDDGRKLFIAGEQGLLFMSADRGRQFTQLKTPYNGSYFGVDSRQGEGLLVYGLRGNVFHSRSDGGVWEKLETGLPASVTASVRLPDGSIMLADESGRLLRGDLHGGRLRAMAVDNPFSFTAAALAGDGSLILAGTRGIARIDADKLSTQAQP